MAADRSFDRVFGRNFGRVPDELLWDKRVSAEACRLYAALTRYAQQRDRVVPPRRELADRLGWSLNKLDRYRIELERLGVLVVERRYDAGNGRQATSRYWIDGFRPLPKNGDPPLPGFGDDDLPRFGEGSPIESRERDTPPNPPRGEPASNGKPATNGKVQAADVERVFEAWKTSTGRNGRTVLDNPRRRKIEAALKAFTLAEVLAAVQGWRFSAHHRGDPQCGCEQGERRSGKRDHRRYDELTLLLRNAEKIEHFRNLTLANADKLGPNGGAGIAPTGTADDPLVFASEYARQCYEADSGPVTHYVIRKPSEPAADLARRLVKDGP